MTTLADIETQLKEPFQLDDIDFLPKGKLEREGKTLCMAFPFADPRVYQNRLDTLAYGEWSTPPPVVVVAGNKLICYVTVVLFGVPHTDVGEANNNEENTGTEAWSQAFKRACSQFGLGRYLYDLEKEWVPFNLKTKQIDLSKAERRAIARKMYQKAGIALSGQSSEKSVVPTSPTQSVTTASERPVTPLQLAHSDTNKNPENAPATEQQLASIRKLCQHLGKPEPERQETMTYLNAKELIAQLSAEYRQSRTRQVEQPAQEEEPAEEKYDKSLSKNGMSTDQQRESISKFCRRLGRNDPPNLANMTFEQAKDYISGLNAEMRTKKSA